MSIEQATERLAMNYTGRDNYKRPKSEYIARIAAMTDAELFRETKDKIWLSAYANNNPRSDYHWQCDVCFDEWERRDKSEQYSRAYEAAKRSV